MTAHTSTALITGGTSGIGRAVAQKLAQLGIHVLGVGRHAERDGVGAEPSGPFPATVSAARRPRH